jgi:hypothetical protein
MTIALLLRSIGMRLFAKKPKNQKVGYFMEEPEDQII